MIRASLAVFAPLVVALAIGGLAGIGAVSACGELGLGLPERMGAFPVIASVVLFGFRGAVGSANRLAVLLASRGAGHPGDRC
jgi:hypothetical protein